MLPRLIDGAAQNSGQFLNNVDQTHLVLAGGKLVLQKTTLTRPTVGWALDNWKELEKVVAEVAQVGRV